MRYEYNVDGVTFQNDVVAIGGLSSENDPDSVREFLRNYQCDTIVTVYFDENHPERSVLVTGVNSSILIDFAMSALCMLLVICWSIGWLRRRPDSSLT